MDVQQELSDLIAKETTLTPEYIKKSLKAQEKEGFGDFSLPCFPLARHYRKAPQAIAEELSAKLSGSKTIAQAQAVNGFLNLFLDQEWYANSILGDIQSTKEKYGSDQEAEKQTVIVEYSSPNIAKSFGIGHLRSTIIGNAIANLYEFNNHHTIRINYLGDWGTQFGKLIYGFRKEGDEEALNNNPVEHLNDLYIRTNKHLTQKGEEEARALFKRLEEGDRDITDLWRRFREASIQEFEGLYQLLGIRFDDISGESAAHPHMEETIRRLENRGLLKRSEGADVVDLETYGLGVALIRKSDGTSIYASRDLATAKARHDKYGFDKMIYEVGSEQNLHFQQVFKTLELMGYDWHDRLEHVSHGLYLGKDGKKLSTRKGTSMDMMGVWEQVSDEIKNMNEGQPQEQRDLITRAAIIYADLKNHREQDIIFDPERMVSVKGNTGPYLLYSYARAASILSKADGKTEIAGKPTEKEYSLIKKMAQFPETVQQAQQQNDPSKVANYAYDLSKGFNNFYGSEQVIGHEREAYRLGITDSLRQTLGNALRLLGITPLEKL